MECSWNGFSTHLLNENLTPMNIFYIKKYLKCFRNCSHFVQIYFFQKSIQNTIFPEFSKAICMEIKISDCFVENAQAVGLDYNKRITIKKLFPICCAVVFFKYLNDCREKIK